VTTFCFSLPAEAKNTTLAQWDFNTTNSTNVIKPSSGTNPTGVILGYGQGNPSAPLSSIIYTGSMADPGLTINGTIYNRALTVNPPLVSTNNTSTGIKFSTPTTGMGAGEAVQISFSQTIGFRSSRYWQILVSTTGINGTYSVPGNGTGSSFSGTISGLNSANASISGTANVTVSPTGFIDFRTINGNSLQPAVTNTSTQFTAPLAVGFVNNITLTLPTGQGYENNADFAFAIVGAFDPAYVGSNGTYGYVSSFAGTNSTDSVNGYNRSTATGGSMRLDLVTISAVSQGPVPTISVAPSSLGNFTATVGNASASQSFTVNGTGLTANITATAPVGFEISTNNSSFSSSLELPESGGNVTDSSLYARITASAPTGSLSGNITLASTSATTQIVALSGTVGSSASLATLATTPVSSSIRTTTATLGGEVTADGGAAITARGVVYSLTATDSDPQVGVSGVTNLPATGTTGVFSVNASALTPGAAYTFKAYATNSAGTSYSTAGTFTALRPLEGWRLSNFGDVANSGNGANSASPAGDGIPNLVKYALCLDPAQWGGLPQPEIANNRLKMSFQRDPARSDITITVEGTSDLVNAPWVPVVTSLAGGAFSGNGSVSETPLQGGLQQVEVSDSVDTLTDPRRRFLRIRTTLPAE
jgi:hypothetical protein